MPKYNADEVWQWDDRDPMPPIGSQPNPVKLVKYLGEGNWEVLSHVGAVGAHPQENGQADEWVKCDYVMPESFIDYYRKQE